MRYPIGVIVVALWLAAGATAAHAAGCEPETRADFDGLDKNEAPTAARPNRWFLPGGENVAAYAHVEARVSGHTASVLLALALVVGLYVAVVEAMKLRRRRAALQSAEATAAAPDKDRTAGEPTPPPPPNLYNPLALTASHSGRASLSKLQIAFFSAIVVGVAAYVFLRTGDLPSLSEDVLLLLGISAGGAAGAKLTAITKRRLSLANLQWVRQKKLWHAPGSARPRFVDIVTADDEFDVYKFQALAFSLIVGASLLTLGLDGLGTFEIPTELVTILGLSQVIYVGGKAVSSNFYTELNTAIDTARTAEAAFVRKSLENGNVALETAKTDSAAEYRAYLIAAVEVRTRLLAAFGKPPDQAFNLDPAFPPKIRG